MVSRRDEAWVYPETITMHELTMGIHHFRPNDFRSSHALFELRTRSGKPEALVITCSDLAIDPYALIPTNVEDLYVVQNFGNLVVPGGTQAHGASQLEQALGLYPIRDIVVCGHASCVVMRCLLADERDERPPVVRWLGHAARTRAIVEEHYAGLTGEDLVELAAAENVLVQLENLRALPAVALRLDQGSLHLHGWLYTGGMILAYDPQANRFVRLAQ
jgi:carbonic anhydrase